MIQRQRSSGVRPGRAVLARFLRLSPKGRTEHVLPLTRRLLTIDLGGIALLVMVGLLVLSLGGVDEAAAESLNKDDILICGGSSIVKIDPGTGVETLITRGGVLDILSGIAIDDDGQILVTSGFVRVAGFPAGVGRVDPHTGAQTIITTGGFLSAPRGIAIEDDGHLLVTDGNLPGVVRVNPVTGAQTVVVQDPSISASAITVVSKKEK